MVKQPIRLGVAVLLGLAAPTGVRADNILEQMQTEVATIVDKARAGIVTIEDARALIVDYNASPLRRPELEAQIAHMEIDKKAVDEEAGRLQAQYKAGAVTFAVAQEAQRKQAQIDARLAYLRQRLANFGHEDLTAQLKQEHLAKITSLEIDQRFFAEQIKTLQQQVDAGMETRATLREAQRQQAHVDLELEAARRDQLKTVRDQQFWQNGLTPNQTQAEAPKSGSGFSIGDGYIVTTADVVQGMDNPIVTTDDGRRIRATLIALDGELNVGLVRLVNTLSLPGLPLGDSTTVRPGHFALSIGNQTGQFNSVALALISGVRSEGLYSGVHFYPTLLQIDGTVSGGNSGAPILNAHGDVIGMLAAVLAPASASAPSYSSAFLNPQQAFNSGMYWATNPVENERASRLQQQYGSSTTVANVMPPAPAAVPALTAGGDPSAAVKKPVQSSNALPPTVTPTGTQRSAANSTQTPSTGSTQSRRGSDQNDPRIMPSSRNNTTTTAEQFNRTTAPFQRNLTASNANTGFSPFTPVGQSSAVLSNTGFAIPINELKLIVADLKSGKSVVHTWFGMDLEEENSAHEANGIVHLEPQIRVRGLYANAPAMRAGVQVGDRLVSLDNRPMRSVTEVRAYVVLLKPGHSLPIVVQRAGKLLSLNLIIENRPAILPPYLIGTNTQGAGKALAPPQPQNQTAPKGTSKSTPTRQK